MGETHPWELHGFTGAQSDALSDFEASAASVDPTGHLTTSSNATIIIDGGTASG